MEIINESVCKHIWNDILQRSFKVFGWGFEFESIKAIKNGTAFRVNTSFIVGSIEIQQNQDDDYTVTIKPDNYNGELIYENITSENLVSQINRVIVDGVIVENRKPTEYRVAV